MRRLPIYLLLPVAGYMAGEPIERVNSGLQTMHTILQRDAMATELAWVSVITFGHDARQVVPLTEISQFQPLRLQAGGGASFGGALRLLKTCAEAEVRRNMHGENDYKPMVFIMTDGEPTDSYISGITEFKSYDKWSSVIACGYGSHLNIKLLRELTEQIVVLDNTNGWWTEKIPALFQWVSHVVLAACNHIGEIPPPPPEITIV